MSNIDTFLETLDYNKPKFNVIGRNRIIDLVPKSKRCGIYVLHFANDEFYAGLSIDVRKRFTQHCKTYKDIQYLSFKTVTLGELRKEEERVIKKLEKTGFRLRNKVHTSVTVSSSPFDEIMDEATQERWLNDLSFNDFSGERLDDEEQGRKYRENFEKLKKLPMGNEAIAFFSEYVKRCIPAPLQTEPYYWSSSCLPSNSNWLYIRLNMTQEVLRITNDDNQLRVTLFVAKSPLDENNLFRRLRNTAKNYIQFNTIMTNSVPYITGGQDQNEVSIIGIENASKMLQDEKFLTAIRLLNLRIMRKTFNLQYRYHCYDLADTALEPIYDNI